MRTRAKGPAPKAAGLPLPGETLPMEAKATDELPHDEGWQFEPKWDGFRCLAFRCGDAVELRAKSGKPLGRYFPEVVAMVAALSEDNFVLDGELVISLNGELDFDALQLRLHPAESRIKKLALETPAEFVLFDILVRGGRNLIETPLTERRTELEAFARHAKAARGMRLSPYTRDREAACSWFENTGTALDGVIAKRMDAPYRPGERRMIKVKRLRSADCVVGGFRYGQDSDEVGSLLLGLYDEDGLLNHVGFTSSFAGLDREKLTSKLEKLVTPPGFTGRSPGGPSRWSTERSSEFSPLKPSLVVEVRYDHVSGGRFRHGTKFLRWRPDKAPAQCRMDQLDAPADPASVAALLRDTGAAAAR
jgi:ATP-dependent DNA ligase